MLNVLIFKMKSEAHEDYKYWIRLGSISNKDLYFIAYNVGPTFQSSYQKQPMNNNHMSTAETFLRSLRSCTGSSALSRKKIIPDMAVNKFKCDGITLFGGPVVPEVNQSILLEIDTYEESRRD